GGPADIAGALHVRIDAGAVRHLFAVTAALRSLFVFQAEDGIRVLIVTGVQTCALPISRSSAVCSSLGRSNVDAMTSQLVDRRMRSEERRVGKEWRSGWSTEQ